MKEIFYLFFEVVVLK